MNAFGMDIPSSSDSYISTSAGRLFAREWSAAPVRDLAPLILFHDSLGSVEQWRDFPAKLAAATGRTVIAYDRLGFGRSDPHPGLLQRDFVQDEARSGLAHIRDAFGIDRMILFGHSVGGGMAIASGAAFPAETGAVITLAAQAFTEDRTLAGIEAARIAFMAQGQVDRLARYHGEKARWVLDAWIETWRTPAFASWSLDAELRRLRCPVLALHGDHDEYGSNAHPERIAALAGGPARAVILKDCHHMPHREMPETVLDLIGDFTRTI
jgi:pimeloyl-ACP methyl ester carboxylesterase